MDEDFYYYIRTNLMSYLLYVIEDLPKYKQKIYLSFFDELNELEEQLQLYYLESDFDIYFDEEDQEHDFNDYEFTEFDEDIDEYNDIIEDFEKLFNEIKEIVPENKTEFLIHNVMLAESVSNYDIAQSIQYYKNLFSLIYIDFDKSVVAKRVIDLYYLYYDENCESLSKSTKLYEDLSFLNSLLHLSESEDIFDVYNFMLIATIYDMIGDVNNTLIYLEKSKRMLVYMVKEILHHLGYIYKDVLIDKTQAEKFVKLIQESAVYIFDDNLEVAVDRSDNYFFQKKNNYKFEKIKKDIDIMSPLKIYQFIQLGQKSFSDKNYKMAVWYYNKCFDYINFYFSFIFYKLGEIYEKLGDYDKTIENFSWIYNDNEMNNLIKKLKKN